MTLRCPNGCEPSHFIVEGEVTEDDRVNRRYNATFYLTEDGDVDDTDYGELLEEDTYDTYDSENDYDESEAKCSECGATAISDDEEDTIPGRHTYVDEDGNEYV